MMTPLGRRFATMVVALVVTLFGLSLPARADLAMTLTDTNTGNKAVINVVTGGATTTTFTGVGTPTTVVTSTNTANALKIVYIPIAAFGNFSSLSVTVTSSSPGTGSLGSLLQNIQVDSTAGTSFSGTDKLTLQVSSNGFTSPPAGPGTLVSSLATSLLTGTTTSTFTSTLGASTTPLLTLTGPTLSDSQQTSLGVTIAGTPFTLQNEMDVTIAAGQSAQLTGTTIITGVPEPSTMAIAGIGALGMIGYGLRRRKALGA